MSEFRTAFIGAVIVALGSISMSIYTPAMPLLVDEFSTSVAAVQFTLTIYLAGYAAAILACGSLSDAFGRRRTAIGFLVVYLIGCVVALAAFTVELLTAARLLQGIGAAAGVSISRAIVRDQYHGQISMRIMSLIGLIFAVGPAVAPTLGGAILSAFGWHALFIMMAGYSVFALAVIVLLCRETNLMRSSDMVRPAVVMRTYRAILMNRHFLHGSLVLGLSVGGIYTLAVVLPFVLVETVKLTPTQFGMAMILQTGAYVIGSAIAARLLRQIRGEDLLTAGIGIVAAASIALAGSGLLHTTLWTVMLPVGLWAFGAAFIIPGATTLALAEFPHAAGAASAMTGFMQIGGGLVGSLLVALLLAAPSAAFYTILPAMAFAAAACRLGYLLRV
ncbi:multidrug effflux MFS transporter [Sinorhizobium psoraleae]|uniref:multidrug effflux MFS transporter n=1 Tax=Sinorhizobium psoraleae TaxID=520838 RepID=UPI0015696848